MRRSVPARRRPPPGIRDALAVIVAFALVLVAGCVGTSDGDVEVRRDAAPVPRDETSTTVDAMRDCAARLDPAAQAAQLLMVLVGSPADAGDLVAAGQVGSYALQGDQSVAVGAQIQATDARAPGPIPILAASDEEGGTVQRLRDVLGREPSAEDVVTTLDPAEAGARAEDYARRMGELGFDMVLAPVMDVGSGSGLGSRSYGDDPSVVTAYGLAVAEGIRRAGLVPVAKHWPGIGSGSADPHDAQTRVPAIDELRQVDLVPFAAAIEAGIEAVMVSHATVPGLTGDAPASRSPAAIDGELRGREGYGGLVVTDALGMGASLVGTTQPAAAEAAVAAGADLAMVSGVEAAAAAHAQLLDAIRTGRLPAARVAESVGRVLGVKGVDPLSCQVA